VAVGTESRQVGAPELAQALAVDGAADAIAHRVELEPRRARAHAGEVAIEHDEQLGVGERVVPPEHLGPDLVELPVAAALRPLAPEHRAAVVEARARVALREAALEVGAHHARGRLGTQREPGLVAVRERVHLLLDDVGGLAERAREELGPLHHRQADLAEPVAREDALGRLLEGPPAPALVGEDVPEAFDGGERVGGRHARMNG